MKKNKWINAIYLLIVSATLILMLLKGTMGKELLLYKDTDGSFKIVYDNKGVIRGKEEENHIIFYLPSYYDADTVKVAGKYTFILEDERKKKIPLGNDKKITICDVNGKEERQIEFLFSKNIYTLHLNVEDGSIINKDSYVEAFLELINSHGKTETQEKVAIKYRGNTTYNHDKKPYSVKADKKIELAGLPSVNKWKLLANNMDGTKLLNKLMFDLGREVELPFSRESVWVDVYLNNEYSGNGFIDSIVFSDIVLDKEAYNQSSNKIQYKDRTQLEIKTDNGYI